jgi:hypothetical protein
MDATFSNKTNVLNATILSPLYDPPSPLYRVETKFGFRNKSRTLLRDCNAVMPRTRASTTAKEKQDPVVGAIHWNENILEVNGVKKKLSDVKRWEGKLLNK